MAKSSKFQSGYTQLGKTGQNLGFVLFLSLMGSYISSIFLSSYFQLNLTESLIFNVSDGWCNPQNQGIGLHCFGDFYAGMQADYENPWRDSITAYPPFSLIFFKLLQSIYLMTGYSNIILYLYLTALSLALAFPVLHLFFTKRVKSKKLCISMLFVVFSLAPSLMVIDRGNNIGFAVPFIYLAYISLIHSKDSSFLFFTAFLCLWKPQLGILAFSFILAGKYRWFFRWILFTGLGYLMAFSFFGLDNIFTNFRYFCKNLIGYQGYVSIPGYFPSNWSFVNFVSIMIDLPEVIFSVPSVSFSQAPKLIAESLSIISGAFLVVSLLVLFFRRKEFSSIEVFALLSMISFLTPSVTFSYYLSLLLPLVILVAYGFFIKTRNIEFVSMDERFAIQNFLISLFSSKKLTILFTMLIPTCFVSWPVTWHFLGVEETNPISKIGINWTFGLVFINLWFLSLLFRPKRLT
jgi:hypothetical protein